ncbi:hypothetical protein IWX91DRAFT_177660 [Phyllosticta citricarpa]
MKKGKLIKVVCLQCVIMAYGMPACYKERSTRGRCCAKISVLHRAPISAPRAAPPRRPRPPPPPPPPTQQRVMVAARVFPIGHQSGGAVVPRGDPKSSRRSN